MFSGRFYADQVNGNLSFPHTIDSKCLNKSIKYHWGPSGLKKYLSVAWAKIGCEALLYMS